MVDRKITVTLNEEGNAGDKLAKFGLAVGGVKAGLDILVGTFNVVKGVLFDFTADFASATDAMAKGARRAGLTAEGFQELKFASEIAGASMQDVEKGIQRLAKNLEEARVKGTGPFKDQLDALNIDIKEFDGLALDEAFEKVADITAGLTGEEEKLAFAQDALSRGGRQLLPILNEGADGIKALRLEARELGIVDNETAFQAEEFADAQLRLEQALNGVKIIIASELMPIVQDAIDFTRQWIVENRELVREKLAEFISKGVEAARQLAPALIKLAEVTADLIPVVIDIIEEWGIFYNQISDFDALLTEEFGPSWTTIKEVVEASIAPFEFLLDVITKVVDVIGDGVNSLAEMEGVLGEVGTQIKTVGSALGLVEEKRAGKRGLTGVDQVQVAGSGGAGATKKAAELKNVHFGRSSKELQSIASDQNVSAEARTKAAAFAGIQAVREQAFVESQTQILLDLEGTMNKIKKDAGRARREEKAGNLKRARSKGKGKGKKEEALTDAELLQLIQQAGESGESLTGLIGDRKVPGGVPPVITVTVNNYQQDIDVAIENNVEGVPGTSAEEVANVTTERSREMLASEFERVKETLAPPQEI